MLTILQAAGWTIWPLLACSVAAIAIIIDRFISLSGDKIAPPALYDEVVSLTKSGLNWSPIAISKLKMSSPLGAVLASALYVAQSDPKSTHEDWSASMQGAGKAQAHALERRLSALATIASAAPLLGLFGTVVGMIEIFASQTPGGADPSLLAHGISVALYNTAFGLLIAIPALVFWRYFRSRVDQEILGLELAAEDFARHLKSASSARPHKKG